MLLQAPPILDARRFVPYNNVAKSTTTAANNIKTQGAISNRVIGVVPRRHSHPPFEPPQQATTMVPFPAVAAPSCHTPPPPPNVVASKAKFKKTKCLAVPYVPPIVSDPSLIVQSPPKKKAKAKEKVVKEKPATSKKRPVSTNDGGGGSLTKKKSSSKKKVTAKKAKNSNNNNNNTASTAKKPSGGGGGGSGSGGGGSGVPFDEMRRLMEVYGSTKCLRKRQTPLGSNGTRNAAVKIDSVKRKFYRWFPDLDERFERDKETGLYEPKFGHEFELKYREEMRKKDGESLTSKRARCRKMRTNEAFEKNLKRASAESRRGAFEKCPAWCPVPDPVVAQRRSPESTTTGASMSKAAKTSPEPRPSCSPRATSPEDDAAFDCIAGEKLRARQQQQQQQPAVVGLAMANAGRRADPSAVNDAVPAAASESRIGGERGHRPDAERADPLSSSIVPPEIAVAPTAGRGQKTSSAAWRDRLRADGARFAYDPDPSIPPDAPGNNASAAVSPAPESFPPPPAPFVEYGDIRLDFDHDYDLDASDCIVADCASDDICGDPMAMAESSLFIAESMFDDAEASFCHHNHRSEGSGSSSSSFSNLIAYDRDSFTSGNASSGSENDLSGGGGSHPKDRYSHRGGGAVSSEENNCDSPSITSLLFDEDDRNSSSESGGSGSEGDGGRGGGGGDGGSDAWGRDSPDIDDMLSKSMEEYCEEILGAAAGDHDDGGGGGASEGFRLDGGVL